MRAYLDAQKDALLAEGLDYLTLKQQVTEARYANGLLKRFADLFR